MATKPAALSKRFDLLPDGSLKKTTAAALSKGKLETLTLSAPEELCQVIEKLTSANALMFGVPTDPSATSIVARRMLTDQNLPGTIARTKEQIEYPEGGAFLFLDIDGHNGIYPDMGQVLECLYRLCPAMQEVKIVAVYSSSSHICRIADGCDLTGPRGLHLYIAVKLGRDIARAMKVLRDLAWCAGLGHIQIATNGVMLPRVLFDTAVHQPNRLVFAAGAICGDGIEQRRGAPLLINPEGKDALDTAEALPPLGEAKLAHAQAAREHARAASKAEADAVRDTWLRDHRPKLMRAMGAKTLPQETPQTLLTALNANILEPDFIILARPAGEAEFLPITVKEVLKDRPRFHRAITRDPLEPDYNGGAEVGILFLDGNTTVLHSLAHGGATYRLRSEKVEIFVRPGDQNEATQAVIEYMRASKRFFNHADYLCTVQDGERYILDEYDLEYMLGEYLRFHKPGRRDGFVPTDIPPKILSQLIRKSVSRQMPQLTAVLTHPTITAEGVLLDRPGYHASQKLILDFDSDDWPEIKAALSDDEAEALLRTIWHPFRGFPFVGPADRGTILAAVLTALLRAVFPTAPAFISTGPVTAAGKTAVLCTVVTISSGEEAIVMPPILARDDAELGKVLTSMVMQGHPYAIFDNAEGEIHNPTLQAFMTASRYMARPLTTNKLIKGAPTRYFIGLTGTNISFSTDMQRRVLVSRIDPDSDHGASRVFDWSPQDAALSARKEIIVAALSLILTALKADLPPATEAFGSFPAWERIIRTTLRYTERLTSGRFADPVPDTLGAITSTGETHALHQLHVALLETFDWGRFTARDILLAIPEDKCTPLVDALADATGRTERLSSRSLGRYLQRFIDRPLWGLVLRVIPGQKALVYRLEPHAAGEASPAQIAFEALSETVGVRPDLYGRLFKLHAGIYRVEAIDRTAGKGPVVAEHILTGERCIFSLEEIEDALCDEPTSAA
jgi:hypothetical protein